MKTKVEVGKAVIWYLSVWYLHHDNYGNYLILAQIT